MTLKWNITDLKLTFNNHSGGTSRCHDDFCSARVSAGVLSILNKLDAEKKNKERINTHGVLIFADGSQVIADETSGWVYTRATTDAVNATSGRILRTIEGRMIRAMLPAGRSADAWQANPVVRSRQIRDDVDDAALPLPRMPPSRATTLNRMWLSNLRSYAWSNQRDWNTFLESIPSKARSKNVLDLDVTRHVLGNN